MAGHSLTTLAERFGGEVHGDGTTVVEGVCPLSPGRAGHLAYASDPSQAEAVRGSAAGVLLVSPALREALPGPGLIAKNPLLVFAGIAGAFAPDDRPPAGVHPSAQIDAAARLGPDVRIGAGCVVEAGVSLGAGSALGAGCVLGADAQIGEGADIGANVIIGPRVRIGARALILPGAVIGSRGFGNVHDGRQWHAVPQLGSVSIGDDVEIGANTTIDRGALGDTVIEDNVRIDNLCQIAHNVRIGAGSALAAQVGVAGSTVIGRGCLLGGKAGINGHIRLADGVIVSGGTTVFQSIDKAGQYASALPAMPAMAWRRLAVLLKSLEQRLKSLERGKRG